MALTCVFQMGIIGLLERAFGCAHDFTRANIGQNSKPAKTRDAVRRAAAYVAEALESRVFLSSVVANNAGSGAIDLAISPDAGAAIEEIGRSTDNSNFTEIYTGSPVTSYQDSGLTPSTGYYYVVSDTDSDGNPLDSASANAATAPAAPTFSLSTSGSAAVMLSSISCGAATSMAVYESQSTSGPWTLAYSGAVQSSLPITGLDANSTYSFNLTGTDSNNNTSDNSSVASVTTAPPAPSFNVTSTGSSSAQLSISYDSGSVTSLQVYESTDNVNWSLAYNSWPQTSLTISGLAANAAYSFFVIASNYAGASDASATAGAITAITPPSLSVSSAGSTAVAASLTYDSSATSMAIYYRTGYGNWSLAYSGGVQNNCTIAGLSPNTQYDFYATVNNSDSSSVATTTTAPAAPTFNATGNGSNSVFLSGINCGTGSASMNVYISNDNSNWYLAYSGSVQNSCIISGLSTNTLYYFYMNDASTSTSDPSGSVTATTAPAPPSFSASSIGSSNVLISGINCDVAANSMQIYYSDGSAWTPAYSGPVQSSYTFTGFASDRTYAFYMTDAYVLGDSDPSPTVYANTGATAPSLTVSSSGSSSVVASISYDTAAASMLIESSTDGSNWSTCYSGGVQNSCTITGLASDTLYYFRMQVSDSVGSSDFSSTVSATVAPAAPTFSVAGSGSTTLELSSIACDSQASALEVYVSTNNSNWYSAYSGDIQSSCTITGLSASTTYNIYATVSNAFGVSDNSTVSVATTLPAPPSLSVNCTGTSSVNVSVIGADSSATGMTIFYSSDNSTWIQASSGSIQGSIAITGLSPDTLYSFRASDSNNLGVSDLSPTTTCATGPTAPTFTISGTTSTTIQLSSIATDPNAANMQAYYSLNGYNWTTAYSSSAQETYTIISLAPSTLYYIFINDSTGYCFSDPSTIATVTTPPAAPSFSIGGTTSTSIHLSSIAYDSATQLQAYISPDSTNWTLGYNGTAQSNITITGLASNVQYFVYLTGSDTDGPSDASSVVSATTQSVTSSFTATPVDDGSVDLEWGLGMVGPGTTIAVQRAVDPSGGFTTIATLAGDNIFYMDSDPALAAATHYSYRLELTNSTGTYDSDVLDVWTMPLQDLSNAPTTTGQVLSWTNMVPSGTTAIEVDRSDDEGATWNVLTNTLAPDATTYTDDTSTPDTEALYCVRALASYGPAPFTDPLETFTLPQPPTGVTVTNTSPTENNLTWTNNASSTTPFFIQRSDDGGSTFSMIDVTDAGATSYTDATVVDGMSYVYRVDAASRDDTNSSSSGPSEVVPVPLGAPADLTASANGQNEIDLSWTNTSQSNAGYTIERSVDGINFSPVDGGTVSYADDTFFSDATVDAATLYYYRVTATDDAGHSSDPSNVATAATSQYIQVAVSAASSLGVKPYMDFTLDTSVFYPAGAADPVTEWHVDWGDGAADPETIIGDPRTLAHQYALPGTYLVRATALTADGVLTPAEVNAQLESVDYVSATILVPQPFLKLDNDTVLPYVNVGDTVTVHPTLTLDGATIPEGSVYGVNWGDGSVPESYPATATAFTHIYNTGYLDYSITVTLLTSAGIVNDDGGVFVDPAYPENLGQIEITVPHPRDIHLPLPGDNFLMQFDGTPGDTYTATMGDGTTVGGAFDDNGAASLTHAYARWGWYAVDVQTAASGRYFATIGVYPQTGDVDPIPDQTVGSDQAVDITTTYDGFASDANVVAIIDFNDGTGPHPCAVTGTGAGTISYEFEPPAPGVYGYNVLAVDLNNWTMAWAGGTVYVWGVTIGDGTDNDPLIGSTNGLGNTQTVKVNFPHEPGVALDLTLETSNATDINVWDTTSPDATSIPVLGGGISAMTIHADPYEMDCEMAIGAIDDSATENALASAVLSLTAQVSTTRSTTQPASGDQVVPGQSVNSNTMVPSVPVLDVATINHGTVSGWLPAAEKLTPGAFVPLDNNDWDYDGVPDLKDQHGVVGDHYLLPMKLRAVAPVNGGHYTMEIAVPLGNPLPVRIWGNADRTDLLSSRAGAPFVLPIGKTVYIEGVAEGYAQLILGVPDKAGVMSYSQALAVSVFTMDGALDVPGGGTYNYTGDNPGGQWITPTGSSAPMGISNPNSVWIKWDNTAEVGFANYEASPDYIWSCGVNVVSFDVVESYLVYTGTPYQRGENIHSGSLSDPLHAGVQAGATIVTTGPVVDGVQRGVQYIDFGLIQDETFTAAYADFQDGDRNVFIHQGEKYADYVRGWATTPPWTQTWIGAGERAYDASGTGQADLSWYDSPNTVFTDTFKDSHGSPATQANILDNFHAFIAAHTRYGLLPGQTGAVNGSADVYVAEAEATWYFDGSAPIVNGVANLANVRCGGDNSFGSPADVPVTTGPSANSILQTPQGTQPQNQFEEQFD